MILNEQQTFEALDKEKKYNIRIQKNQNNPDYKTERLFVNGVSYLVPIGESCEVPETIFNMLRDKELV